MSIRTIQDWKDRIEHIKAEQASVERDVESITVDREALLRAVARNDNGAEAALINCDQRRAAALARRENLADLLRTSLAELKDAEKRAPDIKKRNARLVELETQAVAACQRFEDAHDALCVALNEMRGAVGAVAAHAGIVDPGHPCSRTGFERRLLEFWIMSSPIGVRPPHGDGGTGSRSPRSLVDQVRGQAAKHQEVA